MRHCLQIRVIAGLALLAIGVVLAGCRPSTSAQSPPTATAVAPATSVPAASPTPSLTYSQTLPATQPASAAPAALSTLAPQPAASPGSQMGERPVMRAKVEIVWPHEGADVEEADFANITAYLLAGDGTAGAPSSLDSPPCDFDRTVRLWSALNNEPSQEVGIGQKRMMTSGGRTFPAWDFNDVDVKAARDPSNRLAFFVTVDGVATLSNVWAHAADARTLFPRQDNPTGVIRHRPAAVDARIQIVWPKDGLTVQKAQAANITVYLFDAGTMQAIAPNAEWSPAVRLHWSVGNEAEAAPGQGVFGVSRVVKGANDVNFLAWDFNDVDVSAANDSLNRIFFRVTVDGMTTYSNIWTHAVDARTLFPQPEVLNSCK